MDLKDFVVRFHPGIVKSFERDKNQKQPPLSAPGDLVFTQEFKETKFPFPPKSPSSPTPSNASIDLLEVIPETQLSTSQSPTRVQPCLSAEDLMQFRNRIEFDMSQNLSSFYATF